ncbi:MAG: hypothetical protein AB1324_05590 [Candidatus Micrarchaeota archaeon]
MASANRRKPAPERGGETRMAKEFSGRKLPADVTETDASEVASRLSTKAGGWHEEFAETLGLRKSMFVFNEGNLLVFSGDPDLSVMKFLPAMRFGGAPPKDIKAYGIAIYETSGTAYFVFVDTERRVAVKDSIASYMSESRDDWGRLMDLVGEALAIAESPAAKPGKKFVLIDQVLDRREII